MQTEKQRLGIGTLLLVVSTVLILGVAFVGSVVPSTLGGLATLSMAAGALIVGLSEENAGV